MIELVTGQGAIVKLDDPEQSKVDNAAIDVLKNAAACVEASLQLDLARQRYAAEWITEAAELNIGAQVAEILQIAMALVIQLLRGQIVYGAMRKRMAPDFVPALVEITHLIASDNPPVDIRRTAGAAGDVKGAPHAVLIKHGSAVQVGRLGNIIKSEADERYAVAHRQQLRWDVSGDSSFDAGEQRRYHIASQSPNSQSAIASGWRV